MLLTGTVGISPVQTFSCLVYSLIGHLLIYVLALPLRAIIVVLSNLKGNGVWTFTHAANFLIGSISYQNEFMH